MDGVANFVTAGAQALQVLLTWPNLFTVTKVMGVTSAVALTVISFANGKIYQLSQDALKDLRKSLNEVKDLQNMLQNLHDQAAQMVEEMED